VNFLPFLPSFQFLYLIFFWKPSQSRQKSSSEIKNAEKLFAKSTKTPTFAPAKQNGQVLYGQLLVNPPGLDRSKGSRL